MSFVLVLMLSESALAQEGSGRGILITEISPGGAAETSGLREGDRLTHWSSAGGDIVRSISTPFDLIELEKEANLLALVELSGSRNGADISATPGRDAWGLLARPDWSQAIQQRFSDILRRLVADDAEAALAEAPALASELNAQGLTLASAWVLYRTAQTLTKQRNYVESIDLLSASADRLRDAANVRGEAQVQYDLGANLLRLSRFDDAHAAFTAGLDLHRSISPDRLGVAANLIGLGRVAARRSDLEAARKQLEEGLWLQEKLIPDSRLLAGTLNELGRVAVSAGDMSTALAHFQRGLSISDAADPTGKTSGGFMNSIAIVHYLQGDEAAASSLWQQALRVIREYEPGSNNVSAALHNLGLINAERGHFREAENYYLEALAINERLTPGSVSSGNTLNNLGILALSRGDLSGAEAYHRRAYEIRAALVPDSLDLVTSLTNLGNIARQRDDLSKADLYYLDALEIQQRVAPNTAEHARILVNRGVIAELRGELEHAHDHFQAGLAMYKAQAPRGRGVALTATKLANFMLESGNPDVARQYYAQALEILEVIAPDTYPEAEALYGFARVHRLRGDNDNARRYFERTLTALEAQHVRLGGSDESKATSRAKHIRVYKDYIDFLLEQNQQEQAFDVLERSRAKVLSDLLSERDLIFATDIPEDLERERRVLAHRYESLQADLYEATDPESIEEFTEALQAARQQQQDVRRRIRESSQKLADLQYAEPLRLASVRRALPTGTALVSYSVGDAVSRVFVVDTRGNLKVYTVDIGQNDLTERVSRFRYLIDAGRWDTEPSNSLVQQAQQLYQHLLKPLQDVADDASQLLIVPDGPLNVLPFAALVRRVENGEPQYVAKWKPTLLANSVTVYAQLAQPGASNGDGHLVAFGDPDYANAARPDADYRIEIDIGIERGALGDLPWSLDEVTNIGDVYRDRATIFTGAEATEENAKAIAEGTRFVHFAAHAYMNEQQPLDSSIVLATPDASAPDSENGFLQVWEVYENLRLDADLVTLSACETALGANYAGEGLIGLTRAFQYAGASSVLASLWNVNDHSTSELMTLFYSNLAAGMTQEDALRDAQIALIDNTSPASGQSWLGTVRGWFSGNDSENTLQHPYHWAGFVLNGHGG